MPSQFFGLNIAYTGLLASNAAMNTTANNISNVQTDGYSRQQVNQQAASALRVFQLYGCAGAGVETLSVERVRNEFYDGRYWDNNCNLGEYTQKQYYMTLVEDYFNDDGSNAGFKTVFDKMMVSGIEELMKDPSSDTAKSQFIGNAGALAEYFNGVSGNLAELQKDLNQEIKLRVDEINSIAAEIATLNKQINTIELTGVNANELRDRRTLLLDQLSEIVDIETSETPIVDTNNPDRETGANRFMVKIAGSQLLVDNTEYNGLECVARTSYEKVNQSDIDGLYDIYWENGQEFNMYNASMGGALKGLIDLRDGNNGESFSGQVTATDTVVDGDGTIHDVVTVQVSKSYLQDLNKSNLSDQGGIINLGNQEFYFDSWEYSISYDDDGNAVYSYTFTLSDSEKNGTRLTNDRVGKTATIGSSISYQGIPYYMNQMNEWVRTFSEKINDIFTSGYDSNSELGVKLFSGDKATDDAQYELTDTYRYDKFTAEDYAARVQELVANGLSEAEAKKQAALKVSNSDDSYYKLTASNISVLEALITDSGKLANRYDVADGVEQSDLLADVKNLATDKDAMTFRGSNASEFLQNILSDVALNAQRANTFKQSYSDISSTIDTQRLSISGVDEDEEAINLVKYQNGYNLASKMIQTLTEVYDRLILETGV